MRLVLLLAFVAASFAQQPPRCNGTGVIDLLAADPKLRFTYDWWSRQAPPPGSGPGPNLTLIVPTDAAIADAIPGFFGAGATPMTLGNKEHDMLALYSTLRGSYSPQELAAAGSVNSLLGLVLRQDLPLAFFMDDKKQLTAQGAASVADNTAMVLTQKAGCNGFLYTLDKMILPANTSSQVDPPAGGPPEQLTVLATPPDCSTGVLDTIARLEGGSGTVDMLKRIGLDRLLNDPSFAGTYLLPRGPPLVGPPLDGPPVDGLVPGGNATLPPLQPPPANGSDALFGADVLYQILAAAYCPDDLAAAGSVNSMLGVLGGSPLPLNFSRDAQGGVIVQSGPQQTSVLDVRPACNAIVILIDQPLHAPPGSQQQAPGAPFRPPASLPTAPPRQLTCVPPSYSPGAAPGALPTPGQNQNVGGPGQNVGVRPAAGAGALPNAAGSLPQPGGSSNMGLIVGLSVGVGIAALAAFTAVLLVFYRRRRDARIDRLEKYYDSVLGHAMPGDTSSSAPTSITDAECYDIVGTVPAAAVFAGGVAAPASLLENEQFSARASLPPTPSQADSPTGRSADGTGSSGVLPSPASSGSVGISQLARLNTAIAGAAHTWDVASADIRIDVNERGDPAVLGRGTFGIVYRGVLRGVQPVAIKTLNAGMAGAEAAFLREAAILRHVNRDRNVVQLYGTCRAPDGNLLLLTELMEGGDLRGALSADSTGALHWHRRGKVLALDVARGLTALHAAKVIHRDLKSKNVLLTRGMTAAKVADVGIAAIHSQGYLTAGAGHVIGTLAWSAPEQLLGRRCTEKVDIYSLGVLLWEIATGETPRRGSAQPPPPSERCPAELSALIRDCTNPRAEGRPSAKQAYERMLLVPPLETP